MIRDRTARTRIRQYLQTHGAVEDPQGYATSVLKDAIAYQGTAVAFIQLIAAMDREGEISREVRGKRTYRISVVAADRGSITAPVASQHGGVVAASPQIDIDYDRLARAVVREFFLQATENVLMGVGAPLGRARAERDEYALMLEMARLRLEGLVDDRGDAKSVLRRRLDALSE
jgi:hypothetical protein